MAPSQHVARSLLELGHPVEDAAIIFKEKVLHKPLHLRLTSPDPTSQDARAQRRMQRLRKESKIRRRQMRPLSAKEKRKSGIYDISDDARKYDLYVPLHHMWLGYMSEILGLGEGMGAFVTAQSKGSILASADYHGCELTVVRGRCVELVGLAGIVVRDTKFTFHVITTKNELKVIPKRYTIFRFEIPQKMTGLVEPLGEGSSKSRVVEAAPNLVFEIHGSQFENRAQDRATKKFKQRYLTEL